MKILTWNIQWGRGCDGRVDLPRIAGEIRARDADVVCLQEVAVNFPGLAGSRGEDEVAAVRDALPEYQAFYGIATDIPDGRGARSLFGNLVLARLPVMQVFRHLLPWPADPAVPSMQRACVEAVVEAGFGPLRVMTTHLEYYSASQRMAQVEALRELVRAGHGHARAPASRAESDPTFGVFARGHFAVLCGDFNFRPDSAEHARLCAPFEDDTPPLVDAWSVCHPGQPNPPTARVHEGDSSRPPYCCDFVFASANAAPRLRGIEADEATQASDHQPLLLELDG